MAERVVSRSRVIKAPVTKIFAVVASPAGHVEIDGSGTVRGAIEGPDRLEMGSRFRMNMKMGVPYRIWSTVIEYEQDRRIAWAHLGKHRWRFELEPVGDDATMVTHSFDWSASIAPRVIELMGYPRKHPANLDKTLERLEIVVTAQ